MRRKGLSVLLVMAVIAGTLSGCGKGGKQVEENPEDVFKITFANEINGNNENYEDENYMEKMIQDALGIELQLVRADQNIMNTLIATGQTPDCFWWNGGAGITTRYLKDEEVIRTIPKSMIEEYAPSVMEYIKKYPIVGKLMENPENPDEFDCLRGMTLQFENYYTYGVYLRYDWILKLGIDLGIEVEQLSDNIYAGSNGIEYSKFIEIMDAFVNQDPDGNGVKDTVGISADDFYSYMFYSMYGFHSGVNEQNGKAEMYYALDKYKTYLKDMARLYKEGLVDQDLVQGDRLLNWDKVNNGTCGVMTGSPGQLNWGGNRPPVTLSAVDPNAKMLIIPGIMPDGGEVKTVIPASPAYGWFYVNADVDDAKLAKILQFVEYTTFQMKDLSLKYTLEYGREGVDWEYDENGEFKELEDIPVCVDGTSIFCQYGQSEEIQAVIMENDVVRAGGKYWMTADDGSWMKYQHYEYKADLFEETEYNKIFAEKNADIIAYVKNYTARAILGEVDVDSTWNEYMAELDRLGYNKMMSELNKVKPLEELVNAKY